ncbi:DUF294 nucleotidyltransferase-like domain-containing protein [Alkalicoccus halolimnae]|uniref:DUF294 nucleotidyltransferase-like domain-containing protein n=1 Tax=Alkalicoccus halolimnae TaxID=1667239 RepID=A0A5C7F196_9BACI|nr:DUF294 nucleotidyltransferase-like domain-containing protein [Alkalicoccus halolimnae]TXF81674.1 cyclic nucleotide-binding/CBS domain-containing protein [Alkalicoccus halolimnae]
MTTPTNKDYTDQAWKHPIFSGASAAEAKELLEQCDLNSYKKGGKILYAKSAREGLLLILEGVTEVCIASDSSSDQKEVLEVLEVGEMMGFSSLADFLGEPNPHDENYTVEVRAAEDAVCLHIPYEVLEARWHDEAVRDYVMRQVATRLREIYASLAEQVKLARQWGESDPFIRRVQDLMNEPPVVIAEQASAQEAAQKMMEDNVTSLLVVDDHEKLSGIITEKDIVSRVVAGGASNKTTAEDIMTADPFTIRRDAYYYEALSTFLIKGVKHMPVTQSGRPIGMITLSDLLRKKNRGTFDILQEIEVSSEENIHEVKHAIYGVLGKLLEDEIPILHVLDVITNLYDRLIRHCVDLALEKMEQDNYGKPPVHFGFYVMGSGGRGEQFMLTDQDHFLVYEDPQKEEKEAVEAYFEQLGIQIVNFMEMAGYKRCDGDMMASFKQWRGTISRWEERLRTWGLRATNDNILLGNNFLAFRYMCGDEVLHDEFTVMVQDQLKKSRIFLYRAAELEKQTPVPTLDHPIRALFKMKRDKIDIKKQALFPLYHGLQLLGAHHGVVEGTPKEKISRLRDQKVFTVDFADELYFAYEVVVSIRVHQSWDRYQRGEEKSSEIHFAHMKTREKEELMIALKTIRSLQNKTLTAFGIM